MKTNPAKRLSTTAIDGVLRSFCVIQAENVTRMRHQVVPVMMNDDPRTMNESGPAVACGLMNCGRNEMKKRATLGFSRFVMTPCAYTLAGPACAASTPEVSSKGRFRRKVLTPRYRRYPAPAYLRALKTVSDVARIIDSPNAAIDVWIAHPVAIPSAEATPPFFP